MDMLFASFVIACVVGSCVALLAMITALVTRARSVRVLADRVTSLEYAVFELRGLLASRAEPAPHPFRAPAPAVATIPRAPRTERNGVARGAPPVGSTQHATVHEPPPVGSTQHATAHEPPPVASRAPLSAPETPVLGDASEHVAPPSSAFGSWERFLGVRAAAALGAVVLVIACVFFVRFSIAEGVLTPLVRVVLGTVLGTGMLAASETVLRRRYPVLAGWLGGAAISILYLVVWAAAALYGLVRAWLGFGGMIAITAAATVLAIARKSGPIAVLGCLGGFATPLVLGVASTPVVVVFLYLLLLDLAFLAIARFRESALVALVSAVATSLYVMSRLLDADLDPVHDVAIAAVMSALFAFAPIGSSAAAKATRLVGVALPLFFAAGLFLMLGGGARFLPFGVLALISFAGARFGHREEALGTVVALAGLGLAGSFGVAGELDRPSALELALFPAAVIAVEAARGRSAAAIAILTPWALLPAAIRLVWAGEIAVLVIAFAIGAACAFGAARAALRPSEHDGGSVRLASISAAIALATVVVVARFAAPELTLPLELVAVAVAVVLAALSAKRDTRPALGSAAMLFASFAFASTVVAPSIAAADVALGATFVLAVAGGAALLEKTHYRMLALALATAGAVRWSFLVADLDVEAASVGIRALASALVVVVAAAGASSYAFGARTRASLLLGALSLPIAMAPLFLAWPAALAEIAGGTLAAELALFALALLRRDEPHRKLALVATALASVALATMLAHLLVSGTLLTAVHVALATGLFALARRTSPVLTSSLGFAFFAWAFVRVAEAAMLTGFTGESLGPVAIAASLFAIGAVISTLATEHRVIRTFLLASSVGAIGAALYLVVAVLFDGSATIDTLSSRSPARDVAHSLAFALFGGGLLALGLWRKSTALRIASLAIVLATLGKVFLFDVGRLDDLARVASLTALAVSLIGISFVYQRFVFRRTA
jgi:uncharacterized membrane protein